MFEFFKKKREAGQIAHLYALIVKRSRHPDFYKIAGVPDTLDGRFDLLALHIHLYLRALRAHNYGRHPVGQGLFDAFFGDLDQGLRESGVGDLSVAKKIRRMVEAFYGRAAAYDAAFADSDRCEALCEVFYRNIFTDRAAVSNSSVKSRANSCVKPASQADAKPRAKQRADSVLLEGELATSVRYLAHYAVACDEALAAQSLEEIIGGVLLHHSVELTAAP